MRGRRSYATQRAAQSAADKAAGASFRSRSLVQTLDPQHRQLTLALEGSQICNGRPLVFFHRMTEPDAALLAEVVAVPLPPLPPLASRVPVIEKVP